MTTQTLIDAALQSAGIGLILLSLADVFMTVLYARAGTGPLSHRLASYGWSVTRWAGRRLPARWKDGFLSFYGPAYLVCLMSLWIGLLLIGFTLLAWPGLGNGIESTSGSTPTSFGAAFYYAGGSMVTVGSGDVRPVSPFYHFLTVIDSIIGMSVLTMTVTYVIQIYTALQARSALSLGLHHASGCTGDAAPLLAGLGPGDDFNHGQSQLTDLASGVTSSYESHQFYSVLIYFRFPPPYYAIARTALITLELVTLIETALDDDRHRWLKRSAAVTQLREGSIHVLAQLAKIYLPGSLMRAAREDEFDTDRWARRYRSVIRSLRSRDISVVDDPSDGEDRYVSQRKRWHPYVIAFSRYMDYPLDMIDPLQWIDEPERQTTGAHA